jgi:anti-sigma-K factor RskA
MNTQTRLFDLLADRALEGLDSQEHAELASLLAENRDVDPLTMDYAAALVAAAGPDDDAAPMPEELRSRIEEKARSVPPFNSRSMPAPKRNRRPMIRRKSWSRGALLPWVGWAVAACLLVTLGTLWAVNRPPTVPQRFERFLSDAGNWKRADGAAADPKARPEVMGEIYWSDARQEGFMKLRGLPVNDPQQKQYQLWIFDKQRDERFPVDGGVFNVNSTGEVLVPIDARIPVRDASLFVITGEPPGGVVVSDRKEIMLVAALK